MESGMSGFLVRFAQSLRFTLKVKSLYVHLETLKMHEKQHYDRMMALSEEGERRARSEGCTGPVNLNEYLTPEEQQQLRLSLSALSWQKPAPMPEFAGNQQALG